MTESTGFTIRVVEVVVSIPIGRAMPISRVGELVDGDSTAIVNVLREHKDAGLPWWRIVADDGTPVFGTELSGRALERYLIESTPIVPSPSDFGFAVDLSVATAASAGIASSLSADSVDDDADDRVENAPQWAGQPVSARDAAQSPAAQPVAAADAETSTDTDEPTEEAAEPATDDAADADASESAEPQAASGFAFDALLRGETARLGEDQNRTS